LRWRGHHREDRIAAAACLPLTVSRVSIVIWGRGIAAIGLTEECDGGGRDLEERETRWR
jgi:hypothetical protein